MKFHFICHPQHNQKTRDRLKEACAKRNLDFVSQHWIAKEQPKPQPKDLLYRASISPKNIILEQQLINESIITLYQKTLSSYVDQFSSQPSLLTKANIPTPKTLNIYSCDRSTLIEQVNQLGGFPVILKVFGGSHGIGIIKSDSTSSLFSITDYLLSKRELVIMQEFIKTNSSARLVVLGNQVISSYSYQVPAHDFRSNTGPNPQTNAVNYSPDIQKIAVGAVKAQLVEFGGVDILIDDNNQPYVSEVNFPCNIIRAEEATDIDVAGYILDFLINKATRYD